MHVSACVVARSCSNYNNNKDNKGGGQCKYVICKYNGEDKAVRRGSSLERVYVWRFCGTSGGVEKI